MTLAAMKARPRVDWFKVLAELQREAGMGRAQVAREIGVPDSTVKAWYYEHTRPGYEAGQALLELWSARVCKPVHDAPRA